MTELVDTGLSGVYPGPARTPPTRIGALIACAATEIWSAASGLASGSMSDEFSGQMTNKGCGARPARTSSDSFTVSRTWLSSTARRSALNSRPSRGTLPCTAATLTAGSSAAPAPECRTCGEIAAVQISTRQMQTPGRTTAGGAASAPGSASSPRRHQSTISNASAARLNPSNVTAKDTSGAPPICASGSKGPSVWPKPTTPQGNPPNGTVDFAHSASAHRPANQTGQADNLRTMTASSPNTPGNTACTIESANHGTNPTSSPVQGSSGM